MRVYFSLFVDRQRDRGREGEIMYLVNAVFTAQLIQRIPLCLINGIFFSLIFLDRMSSMVLI